MRTIALFTCIAAMATAAMEGVSDDEDWAYQWYTGEPFRFKCQTSRLNFTANSYAIWDTPTKKMLPRGYDDSDYQLTSVGSMGDVELLVKNVQDEFHGVYVCHMYDGNTAEATGKVIYGLNVHDVKYHDMIDKYRHNIIVAVISTAVFIGPFATICLVWQFHYEKRTGSKGKTFRQEYVADHEMKAPLPENGAAATVKSPEGRGAYENPEVSSTQL